jgi:hypothetical protein
MATLAVLRPRVLPVRFNIPFLNLALVCNVEAQIESNFPVVYNQILGATLRISSEEDHHA